MTELPKPEIRVSKVKYDHWWHATFFTGPQNQPAVPYLHELYHNIIILEEFSCNLTSLAHKMDSINGTKGTYLRLP